MSTASPQPQSWIRPDYIVLGPLARIGPNDLLTSSPDLVFRINAVRSPYTKTEWFYGGFRFEKGRDNVISQVNEQMHEKQRRRLAPAFTAKQLGEMEPIMDRQILGMVDLVRKKYLSTDAVTRPLDLGAKFQFLGLDLITDIGFGSPFGNIANDRDTDNYVKFQKRGLRIWVIGLAFSITRLLQNPLVAKILSPDDSQSGGGGFDNMAATANRLVKGRFEDNTTKGKNLIDTFIANGLTHEECATEAVLTVFAGSDTTASSLRATFLRLLTTPNVYRKVQAEIDRAVKSRKASRPVIRDSEARELPYVQAAIREAMRLHPPTAEPNPKVVPKEGDTVQIDGRDVFLPGGTNVSYNVYAGQLDKEVFGEDADVYRPERWLNVANPKDLSRMQNVHNLIFGYGKYRCLGMEMALMEIRKIVFEVSVLVIRLSLQRVDSLKLLHRYDFAVINGDRAWRNVGYMGLFSQYDFWCRVVERDV